VIEFLRKGNRKRYKSYSLRTPSGSSGTYHLSGYYVAPAADANLNQDQGSTTVTVGAANVPYGAHAFLVAKEAGTATGGSGAVTIVCSGTSVTDLGVRDGSASETIVSDITAMSANTYYETDLKWIGTVTYTLTVGATGHTAYAADFNYGLAKYEDFGNKAFEIVEFEAVGMAGANDTGFDIEVLHHSSSGWTYHDSAFVAGATALAKLSTDYSTESDLDNGVEFAWKRTNLWKHVEGAASEGIIIRITTTANAAVEYMDAHIGVHI